MWSTMITKPDCTPALEICKSNVLTFPNTRVEGEGGGPDRKPNPFLDLPNLCSGLDFPPHREVSVSTLNVCHGVSDWSLILSV